MSSRLSAGLAERTWLSPFPTKANSCRLGPGRPPRCGLRSKREGLSEDLTEIAAWFRLSRLLTQLYRTPPALGASRQEAFAACRPDGTRAFVLQNRAIGRRLRRKPTIEAACSDRNNRGSIVPTRIRKTLPKSQSRHSTCVRRV